MEKNQTENTCSTNEKMIVSKFDHLDNHQQFSSSMKQSLVKRRWATPDALKSVFVQFTSFSILK